MNLKLFSESYNLEETNVMKISGDGKDLKMVISPNVDMKFIGNGFRSEFEMECKHEFVFKDVKMDIKEMENPEIKKFNFEDGKLSFEANNKKIEIPECDIIIKQNI